MKKILLFTICLSGLILLPGCEDYLVKEPPLYVTEAEVFQDPARLEGNVRSLYGGLKQQYFMGGKLIVVLDNMGEDFINVSANNYEVSNSYYGSVGTGVMENYQIWENSYLAINRVNTFLKNIETYRSNVGDKYEQYVAEAKFVRAIAYFYLFQLYTMPYALNPEAKSIPLRLQAESDIFNNGLKRASSQEVLNQIQSDLSASAALPVRGNSNSVDLVTRATQGAAEALKMRVYMMKGEWENAIEAGKKVTGYALAPDVTSVFRTPYITPENIFSLPFDATNRPGGQAAVGYFYLSGSSVVIDEKQGIVAVEGYGNLKDVRIGQFTTIPAGGRLFRKFTNSNYTDWLPTLRYAEVMLNLAECYYNKELYPEAVALVKQVRARSLAPGDDTLTLDGLTGDALKKAIYNERRLEFMGEGIRGLDLLRRGETIVKQAGQADQIILSPDKGINGYIWPIPQVERAQNKLIED